MSHSQRRFAVPKELKQRKVWIPLRDALLDYAAIAAAISFCAWSGTTWSLVFAILIAGVFIYRLQIIGHDGLHYAIAEDKGVNDFITRWILLAPQFTPMGLNRINHLNHHGKFATEEDADWQYYQASDKDSKPRFYKWLLNVIAFGFVFRIGLKLASSIFRRNDKQVTVKVAQKNMSVLLKDMFSIGVAQGVIFGIFYFTIGWKYYFLIWCLAVFGVFVPLNTLRSFAEHSIPEPDDSTTNRLYTFESGFAESFVLAPHNMNYHFEHHAYMYVPYYNLPHLRKLLMEAEGAAYATHVRRSYLAHILHFFRSLPILHKA
jgi:fatty acid desaturase